LASNFLEKVKPSAPQDAKSAKKQIMEGTKFIEGQQKLIRIADLSGYGWLVAEAYQ